MQIQQLVYFVEVAKLGSMNKAAEKLFISQPSLSKSILSLENELKVSVFERSNRGVTLTDDGRKLYNYAHSIITQLELIEGLKEREMPKTLSVVSYPMLGMGQLIADMYNRHHGEAVLLRLSEQRFQKIISDVSDGTADIGFLMSNEVQEKELKSTLRYNKLEFHTLGRDTWYANLGPQNPFYDADVVTMEQLKAFPVVRRPDDYFSNLTFYLEIDGVPLSDIRKVIYVNDSAAMLSVLETTDAFRFGPILSREHFLEKGIRTIPIRNCRVDITTGWVCRKNEQLGELALEFVEKLEKMCSGLRGQNPME